MTTLAVAAIILCRQGGALGTWSAPMQWDMFPIHMSLLPDKTLMVFNRSRLSTTGVETTAFKTYRVGPYPNYTTASQVSFFDPHDHELFCSGHTAMPDGKILIAGGHFHADNHGLKDITVYDPVANTFDTRTFMNTARWYPSLIQMANGRYFVLSGTYDVVNGSTLVNNVPEIYATGQTEQGSFDLTAQLAAKSVQPAYPHLVIDPRDGNVIYLAANRTTDTSRPFRSQKLNTKSLTWSNFLAAEPDPGIGRSGSSMVMVDNIIVRSGGSRSGNEDLAINDATNTMAFCDLSAAVPVWGHLATTDMVLARKNHTLTALADGRVLAVGGCFRLQSILDVERTAPEIWDPLRPTQPWALLARPATDDQIGRGYHSTALLLPDARVVIGGGESEPSSPTQKHKAQIFSPPYGGRNDWASVRPTVSASPSEIRYASPFSVTAVSHSGQPISKFRLVSLGSTTHAYNMNQQVLTVPITSNVGDVFTLQPPSSTSKLRPGYYMLFAVDGYGTTGIPSEARIVRLRDFDRVYISQESLTTGSYVNSVRSYRDLIINENKYLGDGIASQGTPAAVEANFVGFAPRPDTTSLRISVECQVTQAATMQMYLWNWELGRYQAIGSPISLNVATEGLSEKISTRLSNGRSPFIRTSDGQIKAAFRFDGATAFTAKIDTVDFGIR